MDREELLRMAQFLAVDAPDGTEAAGLIRSIQTAEGHNPCFQSEIAPVCGIDDCLWRNQGCVAGQLPK